MEKVITIIAEIAVAALVLAGLIVLTTTLMDPDTTNGIYQTMSDIIDGVFGQVKEAVGLTNG